MSPPSGLLNINKPAGITSRDAVDLVQRLARPAKVGHAGTLDPMATGVLVLCVGAATRLIEYVQRMPKRYVGTFLLGRRSPTEDCDGDVTALSDPPVPPRERIEAAAKQFVGRQMQRPPAYSALKVGGRRAYDLARRGEAVELPPRPIEVYSLAVKRYAYPELVLEIECSGGTYVRSLGRDLAEGMNTAAVMSALVRTAIGPWRVADAIDPRQLTAENWSGPLEPLVRAVADLPAWSLSEEEIARVRQGLSISARELSANRLESKATVATRGALDSLPSEGSRDTSGEVAAVDGAGRLVAILVRRGPSQWGPSKNFA